MTDVFEEEAMSPVSSPLRTVLAVLLVASAVLFGIAARAERSHEGRAQPVVSGPEGSEGREAAERHQGGGEAPETAFGIRTESVATSAVVVGVLVLAALAVVMRPRPEVLIAVAVFALVLAGLDVREALRQSRESRAGLVAAASVLALAHLSIAGLAAFSLRHDEPAPS